jgi:gamma-D-glutamyl-L-lysine dipeptidyl-peptidase
MSFGICCVPVSPLRAEASHRAEMVSQLLFGEQCEILELGKDNWIKVKCTYDGYEGWCQELQVMKLTEIIPSSGVLVRDWFEKITYNGREMRIPYGSQLPGLVNGVARWGDASINFDGQLIDPVTKTFEPEAIMEVAQPFLNTSYLWGGKSVFGVDCSGFCQTVFKFFNIRLNRDAWQQAEQGEGIGFLQEVRCGDLAFFDNAEGRITHVGILLNDGEIMHSSVKVRIDPIDNMGIINADTKERTHRLRLIKRYHQ